LAVSWNSVPWTEGNSHTVVNISPSDSHSDARVPQEFEAGRDPSASMT
jgi:hypothetical protein